MSEKPLQDITSIVTSEKKHFLARAELYPHISKFQDAALTIKGIALNASGKHDCDYEKLWKWVLSQID